MGVHNQLFVCTISYNITNRTKRHKIGLRPEDTNTNKFGTIDRDKKQGDHVHLQVIEFHIIHNEFVFGESERHVIVCRKVSVVWGTISH